MSQVRQDILRFRNEMNGLAKQMDGMEIDLVSYLYNNMWNVYHINYFILRRTIQKIEFVSLF
jgi:hypothetical protein